MTKKIIISLLMTFLILLTGCKIHTKNIGKVYLGNSWKAKKVSKDTYLVSLDNNSKVIEGLKDFCVNQKIVSGKITGLGALSKATLRFFDPKNSKRPNPYDDKEFIEQFEILNLTGNISAMNNKPYLHVHLSLGRSNHIYDYQAIGGHLLEGVIKGAGEFYITTHKISLNRIKSQELGLNIYDLRN